MIDKEYIQETLDKLKQDLKDINTYTSFKNGTYFYDLGFFLGSTLIDELDKYKNIVDELERYIKINYDYYTEVNDVNLAKKYVYKDLLDKIKNLLKGE